LFCISISHKNAGIDIRKKFAFSEDIQKSLAKDLIYSGKISECATLCTCNRTEIYFCGDENSVIYVRGILSEYSGAPEQDFIKYIRFFCDDNALNHLFRVACGIESMVIGEDEILGQVRNAYRTAYENKTVSYKLNMIFKSAITCAKRIKTDTDISRVSISIATLTANEASNFCKSVNALVIGATGKTGSAVIKNMLSHKNIKSIIITQRERKADFRIVSDSGIKTVDYSERYRYIKESDCIISATASPHYTITLDGISDFINDGKKRLFIDLAVPPDIDENIGKYNNTRLIGIDYFKRLAEKNNNIRLDCIGKSEHIINEEISKLKKELSFHDFMPYLENVKNNISGKSFESIIYKMKSNLSPESFSDILEFLRYYVED